MTPLTLHRDRLDTLNSHLMLFFTGIKRTAATVAQSYAGDVAAVERQLRTMGDMVEEAFQILAGGSDLVAFGRLLHEAWRAKRSLSRQVSNPVVDEIYATALSAGASAASCSALAAADSCCCSPIPPITNRSAIASASSSTSRFGSTTPAAASSSSILARTTAFRRGCV